jgi:hypothetical protein
VNLPTMAVREIGSVDEPATPLACRLRLSPVTDD